MSKAELGDVLAYLCVNYPPTSRDDLSNARLTKLVYLADWKSARHTSAQITDIKWVLNHYGPWVQDVIKTVKSDPRLKILDDLNAYGSGKKTITIDTRLPLDSLDLRLDKEVKVILDSVIADTQNLYFGQFVEHVYDTYPVRHRNRFGQLDLVALAKEEARGEDDLSAVIDFKAAGLSAVAYASIRDEVSRTVARSLLGKTLEEAEKLNPHFRRLNGDLQDSVLRNFFMAPEMAVARVWTGSTSYWDCDVTGSIEISGVLQKKTANEAAHNDYTIVEPNWEEDAALAAAGCSFKSRVRIVHDGSGWSGELRELDVDRDVLFAHLY